MSILESTQALPKTFGLWSGISVGWLTINSFSGLSFILFVSLSAGGLPALVYGYIGASLCVLYIMLVFAQCSARFATAGGAYHYTVFLLPEKYRRQVAYPLGWMNYMGWVLTHAACCAVTGTLILGLINLCNDNFDVTVRWRLYLGYIVLAIGCWLVNLFGIKGIAMIELIGCWATAIGFVGFSIALLIKAPKATASFVFIETNNDTGYSTTSMAVLLGLMNSFATLMGLDAPAHLAEELPEPKRIIPRIMVIVIFSQAILGLVWILLLGFSITDLPAILATKTGIPVLEVIRLATGSNAAAIVFCVILIINMIGSSLGSAITMSRQGWAFAQDRGLYWNDKISQLSAASNLPIWSINVSSGIVMLIGLLYLFSVTAFNAIIGGQAVCQILSFGCPALILFLTKGSTLPASVSWNFGKWSNTIYITAFTYAILVTIVAFIPQNAHIAPVTMNYTILIIGTLALAMTASWFLEGRKKFSPPMNNEEQDDIRVIDGMHTSADFSRESHGKKAQAKVLSV